MGIEVGIWRIDGNLRPVEFHRLDLEQAYGDKSIDQTFCDRFSVPRMPEELNESHHLVIVASELDDQTERIVEYLAEEFGVSINYGSFGDGGGNGGRVWEEAVRYGYFSAGGGSWYTNTLSLLEPGARIWANVPGVGYVGVGKVTETAVPADRFMVRGENGKSVPITSLPIAAAKMWKSVDDPETAEFLVRVDWLMTVPVDQAIKEKGFFGNQNSVARPVAASWAHTVERLKIRFGVT